MPKYFAEDELPMFERWLIAQEEGRIAYPENQLETFYILEQDGRSLACGGYYINKDEPKAGFAWGMVHNDHHKQGLGNALAEYRISEIRRQYPTHIIYLDTSQHTYPFFQKLGFAVTNITDNFYWQGLHRYDMELHP
jgi:N-acetylglutamate synthase-like GNAT family acetyltransferase